MISRSPTSDAPFLNLDQTGQSLVQVLIGVGIMGIMMAAFATMMENQLRETRALAEKLSATDLARVMSLVLSRASTCNLLFTTSGNVSSGSSLTFDPSAVTYPFLVNLQAVPQSTSGVNVVSLANPVVSDISALKVQANTGIQVQVTSATTGNVLINFDQSSLVRPIKNLSFPISITTTPSGSNQQIVGCQQSGGGSGSCPTGQLMTGINPDGTPICTTQGSQTGAPCSGSWNGHYYFEGVTSRNLQGQRCCLAGDGTGSGPDSGGGANSICYFF